MDTVLPLLCPAVKTRHTLSVTPSKQQANRRSPGRPPVPLDRIVATALQIVDDDGADALSMRTLAQRWILVPQRSIDTSPAERT